MSNQYLNLINKYLKNNKIIINIYKNIKITYLFIKLIYLILEIKITKEIKIWARNGETWVGMKKARNEMVRG